MHAEGTTQEPSSWPSGSPGFVPESQNGAALPFGGTFHFHFILKKKTKTNLI